MRTRLTVLLILALFAGHSCHVLAQAEWDADWPVSEAMIAQPVGVPEGMARYQLDVSLDPGSQALAGTIAIGFTNHTGGPVDAVPLRLFPNAEYYGEGGTTVGQVTVDGRDVVPVLDVVDTVLFVPLGAELEPGETVEIAAEFETIVPTDSPGSFGIFSYDLQRQTWVLSDWYPLLAGWDADSGWGLDPPTMWGDPTFTDTSVYEVRLTVPAGMSVAAAGRETLLTSDGANDVFEIVTGPVREFSLVIDNDFKMYEADVDGVRLTLFLDAMTPDLGAGQLLGLSAKVMRDYVARYGPYPFDELDIVQTELAGALGVSWSGVLFMDAASLQQGLPSVGDPASVLAFTLAHEIGHQWWGGKIGVNSNDHAFMNESLANYLTVVAWELIFGPEVARQTLLTFVAGPYLRFLEGNLDGVVDRPVDEVGNMNEFGRLIYGKGGLGLHAIRLEIGDEAFFAALDAYAESFAFRIADPDDLLAAFEAAAGRNLDLLWTLWFESAETSVADVHALLDA